MVGALSMLPREQNVSGKYNRRMTDKQVIGEPLKFLLQAQQGFSALKENLDVPAHGIDTDDFSRTPRSGPWRESQAIHSSSYDAE